MLRYFVAGNLWLVVAVALYVGRSTVVYEPAMYSFAGVGRRFYPNQYLAIELAALGVAALFFLLQWRSRGKQRIGA